MTPIPGFPQHFITVDGEVFSTVTGELQKLTPNRTRYIYVRLRHNGCTYRRAVHQLLLLTFRGPAPVGKNQVRHLDGNPFNNALDNLEWGNEVENWQDRKRHGRGVMEGEENIKARLNAAAVQEIRNLLAVGVAQGEIAIRFNVSKPTINHIHCKRTWQ